MYRCLLAAALLAGSVSASQRPFLVEPFDNTSASFIFNALSGLLQQWPNTYHWNGHTVIPGTLEPFTLLYHARRDPNIPPAEEWFAFDPEMSYGIMGGRGFTYMLTYQTLRPAKVVYFDGMSASLSDSGWLDTQEVILSGKSKGKDSSSKGGGVFGEDRRLTELCKWGKGFDVEGIVRMNAGFELMWCDFQSPTIQLVSYLNITAPGTPYWNNSDSPRWPGEPGRRLESEHVLQDPIADPPSLTPPRRPQPNPGDEPRRGPRGGGPFSGQPSPFASTSFPEWLRAATARNLSPQPHLTLDYSSFVTFYNPRYQSLARARATQKGMREHRAWANISDEDAAAVVLEVEQILRRPAGTGSGMNWGALAQNVVEEWAGRTMHLRALLGNASADPELNATEAILAVRRLAYSPLNPFMDTTVAPNSSAWDSFFEAGTDSMANPFSQLATPLMNTSALQRCTYGATGITHDSRVRLTSQELLLRTSIETVLQRLCSDYGAIFVESMDANEHAALDDTRSLVARWESRVAALMKWLDWTQWLGCDEVCPSDCVCSMPLWPVSMWMGIGGGMPRRPGDRGGSDDIDAWKPRCLQLHVQERWPGRRNADLELLLAARHVL